MWHLRALPSLADGINQDLVYLRDMLRDHADYIVTKRRRLKAKRVSVLSAVGKEMADRSPADTKPTGTGLYEKKWGGGPPHRRP